MDANVESLFNLGDNLKQHGYHLMKIPYVLQLNKRDLPNAVTYDELKTELTRKDEPVFEGVANKGIGVFDTLKAVAKQVLMELRKAAVDRRAGRWATTAQSSYWTDPQYAERKTAPLARALIQRDAVEVGPTALTGDEAAEHSRYS